MTFDPDDPRLTAFALGELDEADRPAVEALLKRSPEARRAVDEIRETAALLSETLRNEPSPGLSIVHRIELDARLSGSPRRGVRRALSAIAAGIALALTGFGVGRLTLKQEFKAEIQKPTPGPMAFHSPEPRTAPDADLTPALPEGLVLGLGASDVRLESDSRPIPDELHAEAAIDAPSQRGRREDRLAMEPAPGSPASSPVPSSPPDSSLARRSLFDSTEGLAEDAPMPAGKARFEPPSVAESAPSDRAAPAHESGPSSELNSPSRRAARSPATLGRLGRQDVAPPPSEKAESSASPRRAGLAGLGLDRVARVEGENVVEVVNVPDGEPAQRFVLGAPVRGIALDPEGKQLVATLADRSVSLFDVESGALVNSLQVSRGPVPSARFGPGRELILSNIAPPEFEDGLAPGVAWSLPSTDPIASIPIHPGPASIEELIDRLNAEGLPLKRPVPIAGLINAPSYPYASPEDEGPLAINARVVQAPWDDRLRLVRIALTAREVVPENGDEPPVVAEEIRAEVEFNPGRVARYRPIGFDLHPSVAFEPGWDRLAAGKSSTVLFELEPVGLEPPGGVGASRPTRYRAAGAGPSPETLEELLTISLSYREPGGGDHRSVGLHLADDSPPITEVPDDVRLAAAIAWIGLSLEGPIEAIPAALDGSKALVLSCADDFLSDDRGQLLRLIERSRAIVGPEAPQAP